MIIAQFVFLFLASAIFRESSTNIDINNEGKINNNFPRSILLSIIEIASKCSKLCSETVELTLS